MNLAALLESARVGADALRANPLRTLLSTTGVVIGVAALVAAFAITDGVPGAEGGEVVARGGDSARMNGVRLPWREGEVAGRRW